MKYLQLSAALLLTYDKSCLVEYWLDEVLNYSTSINCFLEHALLTFVTWLNIKWHINSKKGILIKNRVCWCGCISLANQVKVWHHTNRGPVQMDKPIIKADLQLNRFDFQCVFSGMETFYTFYTFLVPFIACRKDCEKMRKLVLDRQIANMFFAIFNWIEENKLFWEVCKGSRKRYAVLQLWVKLYLLVCWCLCNLSQ